MASLDNTNGLAAVFLREVQLPSSSTVATISHDENQNYQMLYEYFTWIDYLEYKNSLKRVYK